MFNPTATFRALFRILSAVPGEGVIKGGASLLDPVDDILDEDRLGLTLRFVVGVTLGLSLDGLPLLLC